MQDAAPPVRASSRWRVRFLGAAVVLAVAATFGRSLGDPFLLWDDDLYVWRNPDVQGLTLAHVRAVFSKFYVGNYAPLQMLSYMVDHALWGLRPAGFVLTDLALHAACAVLLLALLRRLGASAAGAFAGALVFAIHPVQVETVLWISQRKTLLAMALSLAAIHLYLSATRGGRARQGLLALSAAAFLGAVLSKSAAVVLPVQLLLLDLLRRRRIGAAELAEKIPYVVTAAGAAVMALVSQDPDAGGGIARTWPGGGPWATALTMTTVVRDYLLTTVWPSGLSVLYEPVRRTSVDAAVLLSLLAIGAAGALPLAFGRERRRAAAVWTATFFLGLVPVLQIVPLVTLRNDRYLYFPMLGVAGLVALAADSVPARFGKAAAAVAAAAALALGAAAVLRAEVWRDPLALWADGAAKAPASGTAWQQLGLALHQRGRRDEAIAAYRRSIALSPEVAKVHYNLGVALEEAGDRTGAEASYQRALELDAGHADALYDLALLEVRLHRFERVEPLVNRLILLRPPAADAWLVLGHARFGAGEWDAASEAYGRARVDASHLAEALNYEALARARAGQAEAAGRLLEQAVAAGGDRGRLLLDRAGLEAAVGRPALALPWLDESLAAGFRDREALRSDPDLEPVRLLPDFERVLARHGMAAGPAR